LQLLQVAGAAVIVAGIITVQAGSREDRLVAPVLQ
jgi:hypothetical protein